MLARPSCTEMQSHTPKISLVLPLLNHPISEVFKFRDSYGWIFSIFIGQQLLILIYLGIRMVKKIYLGIQMVKKSIPNMIIVSTWTHIPTKSVTITLQHFIHPNTVRIGSAKHSILHSPPLPKGNPEYIRYVWIR